MGILFLIAFLMVFALFVFGLFSVAEGRSKPVQTHRRRSAPPSKPTRQHSNVASTAMSRAGYTVGRDYVQVADIGLLAYRDMDEPRLARYGDIATDTRFLRPFVELWLPYEARGVVRFELIDSSGRVRYADERERNLLSGKNTVLPDTWLPIDERRLDLGEWRLRVLASNALLAVHVFGWREVGGGVIQRYIESDGEISPELQHALQSKAHEAVSLSDLLADQDE